jgi:hypothetical protein
LSGTPFFRVGGSDDGDDPCGVQQSSIETIFTPIFVKILCNNTPQETLIDTGSVITIIHEHLLNKIPHKQFIGKTKNHLSASRSIVKIIGEVSLQINVNGITTHAVISLTQDPEYNRKIKDYLERLAKEARENILKNQRQYKTRYDLHRQDLSLKINDLVLVKTLNARNKFDIRYEGPFKIIKQLGIKTFIVQHVKKITLTRQVTTDVIIPLVERWNLTTQ